MVKWISWIGLAVIFCIGTTLLFYPDFARAASIYKLEYPKGYGCSCVPNAQEYGYFRTQWREWPGEVRLDKTFPRSIGLEAVPTPAGQEIIPPPKASAAPKGPGEKQPEAGPGEETTQPSEGTPGKEGTEEMPAEPGKETPALPGLGLPSEPGGFNPLPSLPPDLNAPAPLIPKEKEDNSPATESKPESEPKSDSTEKDKTDNSTPSSTKPEDQGTQIKSPLNSPKISRFDPLRQSSRDGSQKGDRIVVSQPGVRGETVRAVQISSTNTARGAMYHEPAESPMTARLARDIVPQSYQKSSESDEASSVVRSELQTDASSNELRRDVPPVAVDGFCPVELSLHGRWVQGDPRWTVVYKGFIYRLSGNAQRQEFMANPEKFIPGNGGFDPVVSFAEKRNVPGQVNYCAAYKGRIYMFSSAATQENFHNNPELFVGGSMK
jgi:YHS domain-containing protein